MKITPEQVEFAEFAVGDKFFSGNIFYVKANAEQGEVVHEISGENVGVKFCFAPTRLVNIVLSK